MMISRVLRVIAAIAFFGALSLSSAQAQQCACAGTDYGAANVAGWVVGQTQTINCIFGGERTLISNTVSGAIYQLSTCGTGWDTQISLYTQGCAFVAYNDDNGPACSGIGGPASLNFTGNGGSYYVKVNEYNCLTNSSCGTLLVRLVSLPGITVTGCNIASEGSSPAQPAACQNQFATFGSGAYRDINITANTFYNFTWNNNGASNISGFCATPQNGNATGFNTNQIGWFSGTTTILRVSANRTNTTWTGQSAQLTYRHTEPILSANITEDQTICSGLAVSVEAGAIIYGTRYWQGLNNNGTSTSTPGTPNSTGVLTTPGSYTYYYNGNNNGCFGGQRATVVTVVADPSVPTATQSPASTTVCAGATLTLSNPLGSGGFGTCNFEYQFSTDGGTNWSAVSTTIPSFPAVVGTNSIRIRRNCNGNGCDISGWQTYSWTVVADPAVPTATKSPNVATVCAGQSLTLTGVTNNGGGAGTCNFEYQFSTDGGVNWSTVGTSVPNFAASGTDNRIRVRRNCNATGCDISGWQTYTWSVVADPAIPTATKSPNVSDVCVGATLTLTSPTSSGGTGTCNFEYEFSTNNGVSWSATSTLAPSFAAVLGTNLIRIRRNCNGSGCDISAWQTYSWTVNADPATPTATKSPDATVVCAGATLTLINPLGSGGTGTCSFEYQSSTDNGSTWSSVSTSVPSFAAVAGNNRIRIRRNCNGSGCDISGWQEYAWTVVTDPLAPTAVKSPNATNVCVGTSLDLTGVTDNGGGSGTCVIQYSVNGGVYSNTLTPVSTPTTGTYTIAIRKSCAGNGCDLSPETVYTWNVVADPVPPTLSRTPNLSPVCAGTTLSVNVVSGSGGTGSCADEFRSSIDNGATWTAWGTSIPSIVASAPSGVATTTIIETRRNCNGSGCNSVTNSVSWSVNPVPALVATPSSHSFCSGTATAIALSTSPTVAGTTFSWTVNGGTGTAGFSAGTGNNIAQTLTNSGAAPANVTYTVTPSAAGCAGTAVPVVVTVNPVANVVASPSSQAICNGGLTSIGLSSTVTAAAFNWTVTGTPGTGGFSAGTGNSIAQVLSNSSGASGTVTYVVTPSAHGCTGSSVNVPVTVNPTPAVTFNSFGGPYCISQTTPISLIPFASPAGGVFTGTGVAGNDFVPSLAAVGTNTITYTYTDGNTCVNTAIRTVQVTGLPLVSFSGLSGTGYCINNSTPVVLTGFPTGGTFTGPGISGSNFTPSVAGVGLHSITYTYTDANGCVNTDVQSVNVFPLPTIGIFDLAPSYCVDDAPVNITGFPPGGTFSGPATTSAGVFTPSTAGVGGPYTITYQYTDGNGCTNTTTANTVVNALPVVSFSGLAADYCVDAVSVTLVGSPVGGTFSGPGITSGGVFTPSVAGLGNHSITYTYTNANGCTNSQAQSVEIIGIPGVSFTGLSSDYCIDAALVTLTGNQAPNGTFSGPGVTDNGNGTAIFNPANATVGGPYNVTYSFTNPNGCGFAQTQQVVVNPLPTMSFTGLGSAYCIDATPITLTGVHAPGGMFTGTGITDNGNGTATFNPATAGSGPHSVTYTFTDANGCTNSNAQNVTVNPIPVVSYTGFGTVCIDQPAQPMVGTPLGGVYSGNGVSGSQFFPAIAGLGVSPVSYTFTDANGCDDVFTRDFVVQNIPVITVNPQSVQVCPGDAATFLVSATGTGLSYQWQVNTGSGFVNLNNGGTYSGVTTTSLNVGPIAQNMNGFQYRVVVSGSTCSTQVFSTSASINISASPVIVAQPTDQYACVGDNVLFSATATGSGLNYQWQINTGSGWSNITNGGAYSGATSSVLTVSNYSNGMNGNQFRVVVSGSSNCSSSTTSVVATLIGTSSPTILQQPQPQSICDGGSTSFSVIASGSGLNYQWEVNSGSGWTPVTDGGIYSGALTANLTLTGASTSVNGNLYRVVLSNSTCPGFSVSVEVPLTITTSPAIAQQPVSVQVCPGDDASFIVIANGSGNTFQWQINTGSGFANIVDGGAYSGATTATLNVNGVSAAMAGHQVRVIVQNALCSSASISSVATIGLSTTPIIVTQPQDGYFCAGDQVTFIATASGSSLSYQWQINTGSGWVNLANDATYNGVTSASLTVTGTTAAMSGHQFRLVVAGSVNCSGTALSAAVQLIETTTPVILTQPLDQGVCVNSGASFIVVAAGSVSYQWQLNTGSGWNDVVDGGIYSGATSATLNLSAVALSDDGNQYRVVVSGVNCLGSTTSQVGTLSITDEPVITAQSPDQYICTGDNAVFAVSADGSGLTYQWQENTGSGFVDIVDGGAYAGSTTPVLTVLNATPAFNGFAYRVVVSSGFCSSAAVSDQAILFENSGPVILSNPTNEQFCPGDNAVFTVSAGGTNLTYQWQVNSGSGFVNLSDNSTYSGSNTSSLLIQGTTASMNNYQYRAVISGSINCSVTATSLYGVLTISSTPTIIQQPTDLTYCDGDNASLTVAANGAQSYQWQENSGSGWVNLADGGIYSGSTTATLSLTGVTLANSGFQYRVVVSGGSNCQGAATSAFATITESSDPFVFQQPVDQFACPGDAAIFMVAANGSGLQYQWQQNDGSGFVNVVDGGVFSGANTASLNIADVTGLDGYQYQAIVTGSICTGTSITASATLFETTQPTILDQPADAYACANDFVTFSVSAGGGGLSYQWQVDNGSGWNNISDGVLYTGATTATLQVNGVLPGMNENSYQVIVSSANCPNPSTSAIAVLNINTAPVVTVQPVNDAVCSGQPSGFSFTAVGPNLTYQWQVNDGTGFVNIFNNSLYSGATTPTLSISNATFAMNGYQYRARITGSVNCAQIATTSVVILSVTQQPVANAGTGGSSCDFNFTFSAVPTAGVGTWTQVSGPGTTTYNNPNSPTATATATVEGQYVYQWEEVNGLCSDLATVVVDFYDQPVANAGSGGSECDLDFSLIATPSFGSGTWTLSNGAGSAAFTDANSASTDVSVSSYGTYIFRWTEVNGTCSDFSEVSVTFYEQPVADAGVGGDECDLTFLFNAQPTVGIGSWTYTGPGFVGFNSSLSPVATATATNYGSYLFTWTEINGTCVSDDQVTVNFYEPPVAEAGNGGNECDLNFTFNAVLSTGTGAWSQTSGPGTSNFSNVNSPTSSVDVSQVGTYTFSWTETNGICVSTDAVTINFFNQPVANAGNGGNECDLDFILGAQPSFGVGTWVQTAGPGFSTFTPNANAPTGTVQVSQYGTYQFTWTEVDGVCSSNQNIQVNFYPQPVANAGSDANQCDLDHVFAAVPSVGIGTWTQLNGPGATTFTNDNAPNTAATVSAYGTYTYQWEEVSGTCSSSDEVTVNYYQQPVADAGFDGTSCNLNYQLSAVPSVGNGSWSQTSGPGSAVFTNISDPASQVTVTNYGTYTFTWTEVNGTCSSTDAMSVTFFEQPVADAGTGGDECDLNFTFSAQPSFGTGLWTFTGPGSATFNLASSPVASVTVSTYGTYVFTWTETNGNCVDADQVTVNFFEQPVANAGIGGDECDLDFNLSATLTTGTGVWSQASGPGTSQFVSATSPSTTVTVSQVGTYVYTWTETNGVCVSTAQVTVNYYNQPLADAGNGGNECDLDFVLGAQPSFGTGTWTQIAGPGFSSFLPNANTPNATAQVSQYGTYQFRWREEDGICSSEDDITVNFYQQPVANAGQGGSSCNFSYTFSAVPSAGVGTWTQLSGPGTSNFSNANSPTSSVTTSVQGTYTYQWEEVNGTCSDAATVVVDFFNQPVANAGTGGNECDLDFALNAVPSFGTGTWTQVSGPGTSSFAPNANTAGALVTASAYGTYVYRWTEVNGTCSDQAQITVNYYQQPVANAGAGGDECDLNFTFNAQPSFGSGVWTYTGPGTATFSLASSAVSGVTVSTYGTYVFTWTETNGTCVDSDQVTVNFYQQPVANAGNGGSECDLDFNLSATLTTGTGVWSQASGPGTSVFGNASSPSTTVTASQVGTYVYTWTETNGVCVSSAQVTVNYYNQPVADAGNGGNECDLDFVLGAQPSFGVGTWTQISGPGFSSFAPNANTPNATALVSQYGTYQFRWTEVDGICSSNDVITVNFYPQPVANAGSNADQCDLDHVFAAVPSAGIGTWTQLSGPGVSTFTNANSPTSAVNVSVYGTYVYQWEEVSGTCTDAATVTVNYYLQPVADAGFGGFECDYDFPLAAIPSVGVGTWTLSNGPGTAVFAAVNSPNSLVTVSALGAYTFTWTEVNGTCVSSDNVVVTYEQQTFANAGSGGDECDLTFVFSAVPTFGQGVWTSNGPGTAFFTDVNSPTSGVTVSAYGTYVFTWTETNGTCITSDDVTVNFYEQPVANAGQGGNECDLTFVFNATLSSGQGTWSQLSGPGTSIFSDASAPNAVVTVSQVGTYQFVWTENNGVCFDDATITVNFYAQPVADTGQGGDECDLDFTFNGAISTVGGTGLWTVTNGFGNVIFSDASVPTGNVTVSAYGPYQFTWTETNGTCTDAANVLVNFYQQPVADAGQGGDACFLDFQLVASPSVGSGQWTVTQGPGSAVFVNASSPFTLVTVSQSGMYEFTWTETNGTCVSSDAVTVDFWDQPVANAGQGGDECDLNFNLNAIPNLGSGEWTQTSGPGASTFVSTTSANTSVSVSVYGTYTYTWTETNGVCVSSDDIVVNYFEQPLADAGQGGSECDLDFALNATPSVGVGTWTQTSGPGFSSFAPSANAANAAVTVSQYGQYTFTWTEVNGTCSSNATVTVDFFQQPVANAGPVSDQCDLDITLAAVPSAGLGTWTASGPGTAAFSNVNAPNATLTVSTFGTYSLTWTEVNGTCSSATTVSVTFNPLPVVSFTGLGASYCVYETALVPLTGTPAGGTFSGPGISGSNFIASAALVGSHDITYSFTDANGCSDSQTQTVVVNPTPVVSYAGLASAYCVSDAVANLLTGSPAGGTFSGSGVSGDAFTAALAGAGNHVITYSYTDGVGCTATTSQPTIVNPLPVVSFTGLGSDYCADVSIVTLSGTPAGGAFSGPGISGDTFNPTVAGTGTHTVTYTFTDGNGCTNSSSQSVNVNTLPQPVITPSGTIEICQGSFVTLDAGAGYFQYLWSNGQNGQTILVTQPGTYSVTVASEAGCQALSASVNVIVNALPVVNLGNDTTICTGTFLTLDAGNAGADFLWSNQEITQQIVVGIPGSYAVTVTDGNGCVTTDVISVSVSSLLSPTITANGPTTICQGQTLVLNGGPGYSSYLWSTGDQSQFVNVTAAGTYELTVSDPAGCTGSSSIQVSVNQLPNAVIIPSGSTNLCPGASVTLTSSNTFGSYQWLPGGQTTPSVSVNQAGSYTVTVIDPINGCSNTSAPIVITQAQGIQPTIVANGPLEFCVGGNVVLAVEPAGAFTSFLWSTGTTTSTVTVTASAQIGVSVLDANNCLNETLLANPTVVTVWNPLPIVEQNGGTLAVINGPFQCYQWFRNGNPVPGATTAIFNPEFSGNHYVQVCDENGCYANSANVEFTVGVADVNGLFDLNIYPNPNGGQFTVEADLGSHTDVTLIIRDVVGRALMQPERIEGVSSFRRTFDLSHLANGIYHVQVVGNGGMTVRPVVKQ